MWKVHCPLYAGISVYKVPGTVPEDEKGSKASLKSPPQEAHLGPTVVHSVGEVRLKLTRRLSIVPRPVLWSLSSTSSLLCSHLLGEKEAEERS